MAGFLFRRVVRRYQLRARGLVIIDKGLGYGIRFAKKELMTSRIGGLWNE